MGDDHTVLEPAVMAQTNTQVQKLQLFFLFSQGK